MFDFIHYTENIFLSKDVIFLYILKIFFTMLPRKLYIRRNNNKVDSIETGHKIIAHLIP